MSISAGKKFREALASESPLLLAGVVNAYVAKLAKNTGFKAIYLSGAGVANASFGLPDLGLTSLTDVTTDTSRITSSVDLPLVVDGDTGWGSTLNVSHTVSQLIKAGAAAVHFEDQSWPKRCGHRDGKSLISKDEMVAKIKAAVETKSKLDPDFMIIARTDALAVEGFDKAIDRSKAYIESGAEALFVEAVTDIEVYKKFKQEFPNTNILANITEFGKTPMYTADELKNSGVGIMLFPLSAFRAMNKAALNTLQSIKELGSQKEVINNMETREELYETLDYYSFEDKA